MPATWAAWQKSLPLNAFHLLLIHTCRQSAPEGTVGRMHAASSRNGPSALEREGILKWPHPSNTSRRCFYLLQQQRPPLSRLLFVLPLTAYLIQQQPVLGARVSGPEPLNPEKAFCCSRGHGACSCSVGSAAPATIRPLEERHGVQHAATLLSPPPTQK